MWDDIDLNELFGGGDLDFSEMPMMEMPNFDPGLEMESYYGDPYADWGGGAEGDGSEIFGGGGGGLSSLFKGLAGSGGKGLSSLFGGGKGGFDLMSLIPLLGALGGGLNANNQTNKATDMLQNAAKESNAFAVEQIGGARDAFKPYQAAGTNALAGLQALLGSDSPKFNPIKSKAMAPIRGSMSLADLAKR